MPAIASRSTLLGIALSSAGVHIWLARTVHAALQHLSSLEEERTGLAQDVFICISTLLLGWNLAQIVANASGIVGVLKDHLPALRLFALSSLFDSLLCCLIVTSFAMLSFSPLSVEGVGTLLCSLVNGQDGLDECERTWRAQISPWLVLAFAFCALYIQCTLLVLRYYWASARSYLNQPSLALPTLLEEDGPQEFALADAAVKQL